MPRNKSEKVSTDPRVLQLYAFAREIKATKAKRAEGTPYNHGLFNMWDALDQCTKDEIIVGSEGSNNEMGEYIDRVYGVPSSPARTPVANELITFALLLKKNGYQNNGAGDDLSLAYSHLSRDAKWDLANINVWKQMANHIFRNYGGDDAT